MSCSHFTERERDVDLDEDVDQDMTRTCGEQLVTVSSCQCKHKWSAAKVKFAGQRKAQQEIGKPAAKAENEEKKG